MMYLNQFKHDVFDKKEYWHPPAKSYLNAMDSLDQTVINEKRQKYKNAYV